MQLNKGGTCILEAQTKANLKMILDTQVNFNLKNGAGGNDITGVIIRHTQRRKVSKRKDVISTWVCSSGVYYSTASWPDTCF